MNTAFSPSDRYPSSIEHLQLAANGERFYAAADGPLDGPLVLLLHGFPEFSFAWRRQLGPLAAAGFRVVAIDQRGYGLSSKPRGRLAYVATHLVADVLGVADALQGAQHSLRDDGPRRFSVVGHDWGGIVAWHLAASCPERLASVAILNAPHPATLIAESIEHPSQLSKSSYAAAFQLPLIPEVLLAARDHALLERALVSSSRQGAFVAQDLAVYRRAWSMPGALTGMLNWYRALPFSDSMGGARITVPVRILWGDRDSALNRTLADRAAQLCDDCQLTHFAEATHWLHHEAPDSVNELLLEFLSAHAARGSGAVGRPRTFPARRPLRARRGCVSYKSGA